MNKQMRLRLIIILALIAAVSLVVGITIACLNANNGVTSSSDSSSSITQNNSASSSSTGESSSIAPENSSSSSIDDDDPVIQEISSIILGDVRIQLLSDTVVRIENKGAKGFEDRPSYIVQNRNNWQSVNYTKSEVDGETHITTEYYVVCLPLNGTVESAYITDLDGNKLWNYSDAGNTDTNVYLPSPSDELQSWYFTDSPRVIPSEYGYSNMPNETAPLQGWDFDNDATDAFVFLPKGNYTKFCDDYIKLTGESEMTPLRMLGYWDSRWYAYSSETAIQQIKDYTDKGYSIDVLVIDTDWRVGASQGYQINEALFPDMADFLRRCEELNVDIVFNDHPEPVRGTTNGLDKNEVAYRNNQLTLILSMGLDYWWYDRNWSVCLNSAHPDISVYAFGMYAYQWITKEHLASITDLNEYAKRALIMGNVDGCLHGKWNYASDISSHRYSIQWTGDIGADSTALAQEIYASVFGGAEVGLPYMSSDIGGHTQAVTNDMYVRWIQYGALSTICRVHCTTASYIQGQEGRMPWLFGETAEEVAQTYVGMRYRLLPLYYNLSRENFDSGLPIMRRLDILYPGYVEASANDEYLLGDYLLVAPIAEATVNNIVEGSALTHYEGNNLVAGLKAEYYNNQNWAGVPSKTRIDKNVNFDWGTSGPAGVGVGSDNFSVRWTGNITIGDKPASLSFFADDAVIVYIDGKLAINGADVYDTYLTTDVLAANTTHSIEIKYAEFGGGAHVYMYYVEQTATVTKNTRTVFIPDGTWIDVWSGERYVGPKTYTVAHALETSPIFVREGALIVLARDMKNTSEKDWSELVLDVYPSKNFNANTRLYEDDTQTIAYKHGEYRTTDISMVYDQEKGSIIINIGEAQGAFMGDLAFENRKWNIRIHTNPGWSELDRIKVNGSIVRNLALNNQSASGKPFAFSGSTPDGDVYEFSFEGSVYESYVIELYYDTMVDSAINTEYDKTVVPFTVQTENAGSTISFNQEGVYDWITYGEDNADGYVQCETAVSITSATSYDKNWNTYDNFFTKYYESYQSRGSMASQKDFSFELKVDRQGYFVIYLGGYQCTAKLSVRDRAGNVKTVFFGNIEGSYMRRVVITVPDDVNGSLYVTYATQATEAVGTGTSSYVTLLAVIASEQLPVEDDYSGTNIQAEIISSVAPTSTNLSEAGKTFGEDTLDWMHFGDDGGVNSVQKINGNVIESVVFRNPSIFNDYTATLSYYDGFELGAHTGTIKGTCTPGLITLTFKVTPEVKHILLFTGAWQATNNIEIYNRAGELISQSTPFSASISAVTRLVTIAVDVEETDSLIIFIRYSNENGGNVSLAGLAVTGTYEQNSSANVSASAVKATESDNLSANYTDWAYPYSGDEKANANVISELFFNQYATYDNYAVELSYSDAENSGKTLKSGVIFDYFRANVEIDENTNEIVIYASVNSAVAGLTVLDENGRNILTQNLYTANSSEGNVSIKITISVETLTAQTLTVVYYKGGSGGGNAGLAAIAVK